MVTSKSTIEKIRQIIDKHYSNLTLSLLGRDVFSQAELDALERQGVDVTSKNSLLSLVYFHNFINNPVDDQAPKNIPQMEAQQSVSGIKPEGQAPEYTVTNANDKTKQYIDKLKQDVTTRIESIIRENNDSYKMNALQNVDRESFIDDMIKESTLGNVRQKLKDTSKDATRDWTRVVLTEMSNAIGISSLDRIVNDNAGLEIEDIYVFRISVQDAKTCKYCRRFYNDTDGSPKVYRLSTILSNGSNFGKKPDDWQPVAGATHPNERCSQTIELKPGWMVTPGGKVTYIGLQKWKDYIAEKVIA